MSFFFVYVTHIFQTTFNSDTILSIMTSSQLAINFIYIVPAVVFQWLLSWENTLSPSPLTNLQKLPLLGASGNMFNYAWN